MNPNTTNPSDVIQPARRAFAEGKELVHEKLDEAKDSASSLYRRGKEKASEMTEGVGDYISERPIKSVLIAAGVGVLIGFLISRR